MVWSTRRPYRPPSPSQCEKQKSRGVLNRAPNSKARISEVLGLLASQNPPEQRAEPRLGRLEDGDWREGDVQFPRAPVSGHCG